MKYVSVYKNIKNSCHLDNEIKNTFEVLSKHLGDDFNCYATVSNKGKSPCNSCVEITIKAKKQTYRAESITEDFYQSVNECFEKIKRQIRKYKTKVLSQKRQKDDTYVSDTITDNETDNEEKIVRKKRFELLPMSIDEAIAQTEMLDHDFHLFINEETDEINLIYKRKDSGYGLIEIF